jgi:hypothetical protein
MVKPLLQTVFDLQEDETSTNKKAVTVDILELSQLADALEIGKRNPTLKAFVNALKRVGVDKAISIVLPGTVVFPTLVRCIVGQQHQSFVGVYATKMET